MFRTPGNVQIKVENDTENELNNSEAKIDADENVNGGYDPENCEAKIVRIKISKMEVNLEKPR